MLLILAGCGKKYNSGQVLDQELTIQAMKTKDADGSMLYHVRVFPKKEILEANKSINKEMMYGADSCFYLMDHQNKIYPLSVSYIANGVANSFEYMIRFDPAKVSSELPADFFYQDKYINQKNYQLTLK
jgi:hypothetical protein